MDISGAAQDLRSTAAILAPMKKAGGPFGSRRYFACRKCTRLESCAHHLDHFSRGRYGR